MQRLQQPVYWFSVLLLIVVVRGIASLLMFTPIPPASGYEGIALQFIAATWVQRDPRRPKAWPIDHTYIFAVFAFPVYMVVTRKILGAIWTLLLIGVLALAYGFPLIIAF